MMRILRFLERLVYSFYFYFVFLFVSGIFYFWGRLWYGSDEWRWRRLALRATRTLFHFLFLRLRVSGREHIPAGPVILAANHQSFLDGLLIFAATGEPFAALTAPPKLFPFVMRWWFSRMGYVSISRDYYEQVRYQGALERSRVVKEAVRILKRGTSILIFPEGAREHKRHLMPFHLGAAKIALEAHAPVVPITLKNVDTLFAFNKTLLTPTHIELVVEKSLHLWEISPDPLADTAYLENVIRKHLPASYFSETSLPHNPDGKRAAFFDLDGTLTRKSIYSLVLERYLAHHFSTRDLAPLFKLLLKKVFWKHGFFYLYAIRLLGGISPRDLLEEFPEYLSKHWGHIFFSRMLEVLELHRKSGEQVFLISEEPQEILDAVAARLGATAWGTKMGTEGGVFTGRVKGHIMKDEWKRHTVIELAQKHHIDLANSFAYGNSWHDYDMLRSVGHAAIVNPSRGLKARARGYGWRIIHER